MEWKMVGLSNLVNSLSGALGAINPFIQHRERLLESFLEKPEMVGGIKRKHRLKNNHQRNYNPEKSKAGRRANVMRMQRERGVR